MSRVFDFRFLVYLLVGGIQWLIDLLVYTLSWPLLGVAGGQALARFSGAAAGFFLNRNHTFEATGSPKQTARQALRFVAVLVTNWGVSTLLVLWLLKISGLSEVSAKVCVDLVVVPGSFLLLKKWVFASPEDDAPNKK